MMLPSLIGMSTILKPMLNSHLWHILEELTFQAFLLQYLVVIWFFASREQNTLISKGYLIPITVSSCILSYCCAVPFYLLVERPFRNFLDLILFPKSSIFKKQKDLDDSDESTDSDEDKKKLVLCGFCNDEPCDCKCLLTKRKCKCAVKSRNKPEEDSVLEQPNMRSILTTRSEQKKVSFNVHSS